MGKSNSDFMVHGISVPRHVADAGHVFLKACLQLFIGKNHSEMRLIFLILNCEMINQLIMDYTLVCMCTYHPIRQALAGHTSHSIRHIGSFHNHKRNNP